MVSKIQTATGFWVHRVCFSSPLGPLPEGDKTVTHSPGCQLV